MRHASSTAERPAFMQQQYAFAARIRDPRHAPAPADVPARRMALYEELFYNNINEALTNAFPVLRKLHTDVQWHTLVRDYFTTHRARTPLFHQMAREFIDYLQHERGSVAGDRPFMLELAHYEWVELELLGAEDELPPCNDSGDLLDNIPLLSPLTRLLSYHYPVHRIGPDYIPQHAAATPTHLLVWRDRQDEIGFMTLNPVTARLLQHLSGPPQASGRELLEQIAAELHHPNPQTVIEGGRAILEELRQRDILLGTHHAAGERE
jgi:hypothetical protein